MPGSFLSLLAPGDMQTLLHVLYGYVFPITVLGVWVTLAVLDLAHRAAERRSTLAWCALIFLVPYAGSAAYLLSDRTALSRVLRMTVLAGGAAMMLAAYAASFALVG
jgi:hypothetical protein